MQLLETFTPLRDLLRLKKDQQTMVLLLAVYFFLSLASVSLVKSLQNAVYLGREGFDWRLPTLYLGIAVISGPLVLLYRWLARCVSHLLITSLTVAALAAGLGFFWLVLDQAGSWAYQVFYIWGAIFSVLLPTQGWIFAYHLFTPRTAKRVFVVLGTGGVFGGVIGGYYTALAAEYFGSHGLFLHVFLMLAMLEIVLFWVFRLSRNTHSARTPSDNRSSSGTRPRTVQTLLGSRHLKYLAALILLTGLVSTLIDLVYKWSLDARYPASEAEITQFFGALLGTTFLVSALIQLVGTSVVLRRFGMGPALLVLPLGLMLGSLGIVVTGAFWAVVLAKGIDGSLRSSIEQTSVELLYVPVSDSQSIPLKSFMELVVVRLGDGIGAGLFLLVISLTGYHVYAVGVLILAVAALWVLVSRGISEEYAQMLRRSLEDESRSGHQARVHEGSVGEMTLIEALPGGNRRKILFVLRQLRQREARLNLSDITSADLSGDAFSINPSTLYRRDRPMARWLHPVSELAAGEDAEIAAAALDLLVSQGFPPRLRDLQAILSSDELPPRRYLIYIYRYAEEPVELVDSERVLRWAEEAGSRDAIELCRLMQRVGDPRFQQVLRSWLDSEDRELCRAAMETLGSLGDMECVGALAGALSQTWSRRAAQTALAGYGDAVVKHLLTLVRGRDVPVELKREIPKVLARIDSPFSRSVLVASLYTPDPIVAYRALKALNRIRASDDLSYNQEAFQPLLQIWAKEYYGLLNMDLLLHSRQNPESRLLQKAIKERLDWSIEKIFRGLELFLPLGDAYFSYLGFTSSRQDLRENAIELIDSRVRGELRQTLLPIFAELHPYDVVRKGREVFKLPSDPASALAEAFFNSDPWLKCCTIGAVLAERLEELRPHVEQAREDINPMVKETARWALARWGLTATS